MTDAFEQIRKAVIGLAPFPALQILPIRGRV
jgi:hypothetical protein